MALSGFPSAFAGSSDKVVTAAGANGTRQDVRRAVFLDRDGVVNRGFVRRGKPYPPSTVNELELLPGVEEAVHALKAAGLMVIVVTNQPDVRTGKQSPEILNEMHDRLRQLLPLDDIKSCLHVDSDNCDCRKPKPGMLEDAAREYGINLRQSFMVGDRWRDIGAGQAVGCETYFVDYGYEERQPNNPDVVVSGLGEASRIILSKPAIS